MRAAALAFLLLTAFLFLVQYKSGSQAIPLEKESIISGVKPLSSLKSSIVLSGDGTMKVTMKSQEKLDGTTDYSFFVSDSSDKNSKLLYSKSIKKGSMDIPKNTWSPDNKYLFILDKEDGDHYLVFKANGELFANGDKFIDATLLFEKKQPSFLLSEMTGWDGLGLMHVRATNTSFWFDIDSQNFLQLAR